MAQACSHCGTAHDRIGQRYCRSCATDAQRRYRQRLKEAASAQLAELRRLKFQKMQDYIRSNGHP